MAHRPADPKVQGLHDTGQRQGIQEESWRSIDIVDSNIDSVVEARGFEPDQWLVAINTCKMCGQKGVLRDTLWHTTASTTRCLLCFVYFLSYFCL